MKKLLITAASLALSALPAAAAHADTSTNISGTDNTGYTTSTNKDNSSDTSTEAYSANTVKYQAMYYVNYDASTINWYSQHASTDNSQSSQADYFRNMQDHFANNSGDMWGNMGSKGATGMTPSYEN